ncbi:hypothetical protein Pfo_019962, partial [Paulownia fortunei]
MANGLWTASQAAKRVADKIMGSACFYCTALQIYKDRANPLLCENVGFRKSKLWLSIS